MRAGYSGDPSHPSSVSGTGWDKGQLHPPALPEALGMAQSSKLRGPQEAGLLQNEGPNTSIEVSTQPASRPAADSCKGEANLYREAASLAASTSGLGAPLAQGAWNVLLDMS